MADGIKYSEAGPTHNLFVQGEDGKYYALQGAVGGAILAGLRETGSDVDALVDIRVGARLQLDILSELRLMNSYLSELTDKDLRE